MNDFNLAEFLMKDVGTLEKWKDGYSETIQEFWDTIVEPLLPKKETMEKLTDMLIKYCDEPDAVFAIRAFSGKCKGAVEKDKIYVDKKSYSTLRRGFFTHTNLGFDYFFTDNFFAHYFQKMAMNDYVPEYEEFKKMMLTHEFPGRFGPYDSKYEVKKATYDITGKRGIDPKYGDANYKLSHIFDTGEGYWSEEYGKSFTRKHICQEYFERGKYDEWKQVNGEGNYIREQIIEECDEKFLRKWLKAQFLRLACPMNYVLTPLPANQKPGVKLSKNDVGEEPKFQRFVQYKFKQIYGDVFEKYCEYLMLEPSAKGADYGDTVINLEYSLEIGVENKRKIVLTKKNIADFLEYILSDKLSHCTQCLIDEDYCIDFIGLSQTVYVEKKGNLFEIRKTWKDKADVEKLAEWLREELSYLEEAENENDVLGMFIREFNEQKKMHWK